MRLLPVTVVALAAALTACSATGTALPTRTPPSAPSSPAPGAPRAVRLDGNTVNATVLGSPFTTTATVRRDNPDPLSGGDTSSTAGGVLTLHDCGPQCAYTVTVPVGTAVSADLTTTKLVLRGVGDVHVDTAEGDVEIDDIARGRTEVRTNNGTIHGTGLRGDGVHAETTDGAIDLALATPQNVTAMTNGGAVTLTVPPAAYRIQARSTSGAARIGIPDDPSGRYLLDLGSTVGAITVRPG